MSITEKPLTAESGWKELTAPDLIKWEKPGETVQGVLTSVGIVILSGKKVPQYLLTLGDKQFKFLGTFDITQKLTPAHRGCKVRLKYLGTDDNVTGGPSNQPMKVFSIQISGTPSGTHTSDNIHGQNITDEDIPF